MWDVKAAHARYYSHQNKKDRDAFLIKHMDTSTPKRKVKGNNVTKKSKSVTTKYFIYTENKRKTPICKQSFMDIFIVGKDKVSSLAKHFYKHGTLPTETRGGDHCSHIHRPRKTSVKNFIESLQCVESHYCRGRSERKYLPCTLSIKKLWRMYNASCDNVNLRVKESYFRSIFDQEYNVRFGTPLADACSLCISLKEKLKREMDPQSRSDILIEKRVHSLKAAAFYSLLKDSSEKVFILSFDCENNLPLPKVPDQRAYYSRQLYIYNLCIVQGHSKARLT